MNDIRILLAEDHEIVRKGIIGLIEKIPGMKVVGEASNGQEAVFMARDLDPDVIVMDVMMPGLNGIEATKQILSHTAQIRIITLSLHADREYVTGMLKAGALGYLLKDCAFQELIEAIRVVNTRNMFLSQLLIESIAKELLDFTVDAENKNVEALTAYEQVVLRLLAEGKKPDEIATLLSLRPNAIKKEYQNLINKWLILNC